MQKKQEQAVKRKTKKEREAEEAAAKAAAEAAAAAVAEEAKASEAAKPGKPAPAKAPTVGTLHRPAAKPGERAKPIKKSGAGFQEEAARRRALKLRGDVTGGAAATGWRQPKVGHRRHDEEGGEGAAPRLRRRARSSATSRFRRRSPLPTSRASSR